MKAIVLADIILSFLTVVTPKLPSGTYSSRKIRKLKSLPTMQEPENVTITRAFNPPKDGVLVWYAMLSRRAIVTPHGESFKTGHADPTIKCVCGLIRQLPKPTKTGRINNYHHDALMCGYRANFVLEGWTKLFKKEGKVKKK
jgi:hypothetical protein